MNRQFTHWFLTAFFSLALVSQSLSLPPEKRQVSAPTSQTIDNTTFINANRILMFVTNHGNFGRDLAGVFGNDYGTYFPFTTVADIQSGANTTSPLYAGGLWLGGVDAATNDTLVTIAEYSSEYVPGPMAGGTYQTDRPEFRVYKLYSDSLADNPNQDYQDWPVTQGAPVDGYGAPEMRGDQMTWTVYNDADPAEHTSDAGSTAPMGIEVQQTVWSSKGTIIDLPPTIEVQHVGSGGGSVRVFANQPSLLNGHDYMVIFTADSSSGGTWDLIDRTTGETKLTGMSDRSGGAPSPSVDGLQVAVADSGHIGVTDWTIPGGTRRFTWAQADYGFEGFNGALGWADPYAYFNGEPAAISYLDLPEVLLKLAKVDSVGNFDPGDTNVSYGYRYMRGCQTPPAKQEFAPFIFNTDASYDFQAFEKNVPLSAWDMSVDPPRRLTVGFLENNVELGTVDGKYWPPDSDSLTALGTTNAAVNGPREWLWIYMADYSETPNAEFELNPLNDIQMPIMYWATWARRGSNCVFEDGDEFLIIPGEGYSLTPADTFFFKAPDPIADPTTTAEDVSLLLRYKLINKGNRTLNDFFLSLWLDPDLGSAGDDLVGCDTLNNLFFCYNATDYDAQYQGVPPAIGFKVLEGPVVYTGYSADSAMVDGRPLPNYKNLGMYSFNKYINGTDPDWYVQSYQYMMGLEAKNDGAPYYNPTTGQPTRFVNSGDPVTATGWIDNTPSDRRMMASFGPFTFRPGDTQQVLFKMAVGQGTDRLNSISVLRDILLWENTPTDLDDEDIATLPTEFLVAQNYPNPFNPSTTIRYALPKRADVNVSVFNLLGQRVATLVNRNQPAGEYTAVWNGSDASGRPVASGIYFYRVRAGDEIQTRKMMLLK